MKKKSFKLNLIILLIIIIIITILSTSYLYTSDILNLKSSNNQNPEQISSNLFDEERIKTAPDGTKFIVEPNKILSGGPSKGGIGIDKGIPALAQDNINFVSVQEADKWIKDNELVLALELNGVKRVYPLQIMVWHEIANDKINDIPLLVTYCPLCGSGIAYERYIDFKEVKKETRFGTSGKLYNSNLVMYDELTNTYWQQIDGNAIIGELTGQELKEISIDTVVWRDYKEINKDAKVLSQETGFSRDYGKDPYGNYYENSFLIFPVDNEDNRIHPKTVIFGIEVNGKYKAYKEEDLLANPTIEDTLNGVNIILKRDKAGIIKITNQDSGEEIVKERDFWFAWYAFHPETELYESE